MNFTFFDDLKNIFLELVGDLAHWVVDTGPWICVFLAFMYIFIAWLIGWDFGWPAFFFRKILFPLGKAIWKVICEGPNIV